ncbi:MAG TPA: hypothetical protein VNC78_00835 [Actinomycetota bacterium]|nr:hypothetical protein [Actinomycetota bacterium]
MQHRLTRGEVVFGTAAVVLVALSAVPLWATYVGGALGVASVERSNAFAPALPLTAKLALLVTFLGLAIIVARMVLRERSPVLHPAAYLVAGIVIAVLLVAGVVAGPSLGLERGLDRLEDLGLDNPLGITAEVRRGPLLFVAWVLALPLIAGGFLHFADQTRPVKDQFPEA